MTWPETVDQALCYGWIDRIRRRLSNEAYAIRFTLRRPGSTWSRGNLEKYGEPEGLGRIRPPGAAAFGRRIEEKTAGYSYEDGLPKTLPGTFLQQIEVRKGTLLPGEDVEEKSIDRL